MDMRLYVSCFIPSIKQTLMRIVHTRSDSTVLEARDEVLEALGVGEKKVLQSLGMEQKEYLFSGTQVYSEVMQSHVTDHALRLLDQHRLHPCHTLQEEFLRHEHRNPKRSDIFKLRLHLPKTEYEEESADDDDDDDDVYSLTAAAAPPHQQQKKRSLVHEIQCDAAIKKAKIVPGSMVISIRSLKAHLKTADPLSCPEWMELNLPVADIAQWACSDNRFAANNGRFAYMGRREYGDLRDLISQLLAERERSTTMCETTPRAYEMVKAPEEYNGIIGNILVVGPVGSGKSHVLAAAASDFTEEFQTQEEEPGQKRRRRRVVTIMDCALLKQDRAFRILRDALFVAFGDDDQNIQLLSTCSNEEDLVHFCEGTEDHLLWLLDQWECVKGCGDTTRLQSLLFRLCCHHSMVRVASTTCDIVQYVFHSGQPPAKIFFWDDCLNSEELECWGKWKFVASITDCEETVDVLDDKELQYLLDMTGRLPGFLSAWCDALKETVQYTSGGGKFSFDDGMAILQTQAAVEKMRDDMESMFECAIVMGKLSKLIDGVCKYLFGAPMNKPLKDIDSQYFRVVDGRGALSCGLVGYELARLVHKHKESNRFFEVPCIKAIKLEFGAKGVKHPVLGGLLVERAIIGLIADGRSLVLAVGKMTKLCPTVIQIEEGVDHSVVEDLHKEFIKDGKEEALFMFLTLSAAYKAVDAVLLKFQREAKGCHLYITGLQVTVGKLPKHRLCRKIFMTRECLKWVPTALNVEEDVSWCMNWITPEVEIANYPGKFTKDLGVYQMQSCCSICKGNEVDCLEVFTTFRQLDTRLGFLDAVRFNL